MAQFCTDTHKDLDNHIFIYYLYCELFSNKFDLFVMLIFEFQILLLYSWYVKITKADVETLLLKKKDSAQYVQPDGAFLVRPSESTPGDFTLSVK